jgi:O-antigen ligase
MKEPRRAAEPRSAPVLEADPPATGRGGRTWTLARAVVAPEVDYPRLYRYAGPEFKGGLRREIFFGAQEVQCTMSRWEAGVLWSLTMVVLLAPWPLGSDRPLPASLLCAAVGVLLLAWGAGVLVAAVSPSVPIRPLLPAAALFAGAVAWVTVQGSSFTPGFLHHPYWREARAVLGVPVAGAISVNPEATWARLQGLLAYGGVFWLALQLCAARSRARQVMLALSLAGLLYALYGLYAYFDRRAPVTSTFVNRNSYATYAGLTLLCGLGFVVQSFAGYARVDVPLRRALVHALSRLDLATTAGMLSCLACAMALLLTRSRGALVAFVVALLLYVWRMRSAFIIRARAFYVLFIAIMLVSAVGLMLYSGEGTLRRFEESGGNFSNRIVYYRTTWQAMQERPLLGTGYGTYADAFMAYNRPETGTYFLDKAHNTYLQLLMELGWPAAFALFSSVGCLAFGCWRGLPAGARDNVYPATALACSTFVGVQSLVDFSLEMPANAVTYALLLGVGCAQALRPGRRRPEARPADGWLVVTSPG